MASLKNLIAKSKAAAKVRNVDRRDDFKSATSSLDAIFGNLRSTQRGTSRTMTKANARILSNMGRVLDRAKDNRSIPGKAGAGMEDLYGSVLGSSIRQQLGSARATAGSTAIQAGGLERQGAMTHRAGVEAMDLLQEGTAMAKQSAKSGLAEALAIRAGEDAALTAEAKLEIAKERMAAREAGTSGPGGAQAAEALQALQAGVEAGWTKSTALANITSQAELYNLGPAATARLKEFVNATWTGGMDDQASTYQPVDENGVPIQTSMDAEDQVAINEDIWRFFSRDDDPDNVPTKKYVLSQITDTYMAAVDPTGKGLNSVQQKVLDEQLDYAEATYARILAKVRAPNTGGTSGATPSPDGKTSQKEANSTAARPSPAGTDTGKAPTSSSGTEATMAPQPVGDGGNDVLTEEQTGALNEEVKQLIFEVGGENGTTRPVTTQDIDRIVGAMQAKYGVKPSRDSIWQAIHYYQ